MWSLVYGLVKRGPNHYSGLWEFKSIRNFEIYWSDRDIEELIAQTSTFILLFINRLIEEWRAWWKNDCVKCTIKEGETVSRWREPERNLNWKRYVEMDKIEVLEESRVRALLSRWLPPLDIAPHLQCSAAQEKFHHASQISPMTPFLPLPETFSSHLPCVCYSSGMVVKKSGRNAWNFHIFIPLRSSPTSKRYRTAGPRSLYCSA